MTFTKSVWNSLFTNCHGSVCIFFTVYIHFLRIYCISSFFITVQRVRRLQKPVSVAAAGLYVRQPPVAMGTRVSVGVRPTDGE